MNYYQRLKDLREAYNLNQEDIAKLLQTTQGYYSKYELGKHMMPIDKYITLARFYNVSLDYVTGLIATPKP